MIAMTCALNVKYIEAEGAAVNLVMFLIKTNAIKFEFEDGSYYQKINQVKHEFIHGMTNRVLGIIAYNGAGKDE